MATFVFVWFGELISVIGSSLTNFALGVWVYQTTGSATQFALIALFSSVPGILVSPFAGVLIDRWDRRYVMILSDVGAGVCTLIMALLLAAGQLQVWHIYILVAISNMFSAFQWPAFSAVTTLIVPKKHLGRASGMGMLGEALAQLVAPALAGMLVVVIQVQGVMFIDFATFLFALSVLLIVRFPKPDTTEQGKEAKGSVLKEAAFGWRYIMARPGLLSLLLYFAATNFVSSLIGVLFAPLALSFTTADVMGWVMSFAGFGMLIGSVVMSAWGGPKRRVLGVVGSGIIQGVFLMGAGLRADPVLMAISGALYFLTFPIMGGSSQAIWQSKTEPDIQGRVFAVRRMIAWSTLPISYLLAGPLADTVFEPLMAVNGALSGSVGQILGVGPGRGIGLLIVLMGATQAVFSLFVLFYPRLRNLEDELPDVIVDEKENDETEKVEAVALA
jgi:MFS transporter, DHA3 family, macrolide efflux protein